MFEPPSISWGSAFRGSKHRILTRYLQDLGCLGTSQPPFGSCFAFFWHLFGISQFSVGMCLVFFGGVDSWWRHPSLWLVVTREPCWTNMSKNAPKKNATTNSKCQKHVNMQRQKIPQKMPQIHIWPSSESAGKKVITTGWIKQPWIFPTKKHPDSSASRHLDLGPRCPTQQQPRWIGGGFSEVTHLKKKGYYIIIYIGIRIMMVI